MKNIILLFCASFTLITLSCNSSKSSVSADNVNAFGEAFNGKKSMDFDQLLAKLTTSEAIDDVVVKGKVTGVCQAKGCWMTLVSETNPGDEALFVKFKDYGFFMPKDLSGGTVLMKGKAFKEVTSVEELRHYAEDDGKSPEEIAAINAPKTELKFLASGVQIVKR